MTDKPLRNWPKLRRGLLSYFGQLHICFIIIFMNIKIGSIVIRCYEFDRMLAFWQAALGYVPKYPPSDDWVILSNPTGEGPNLSLDKSPEKRTGKRSWLHLDLYATDQPAEVERLLSIGAKKYPWRYPPDADYVVLEDPDGNLFCVIQK